ncbi:Macrophage mannose receptor 1 [Holothuria leucospilota]|uniref:Macrophage mannose receptor 1 n=1 Tax=Holothuria leucospilota TaxID=206669 RepID=A0A9Q1C0H6_HOLLE|nr:Macrophage mannose receptor 1 [Holothuria leucospilota]
MVSTLDFESSDPSSNLGVTADECQAGIVYYSPKSSKALLKFSVVDDPCACTSVVLGGVTSTTSLEAYNQFPTASRLIYTTNISRIRSHFGCQKDVTASPTDDDARMGNEITEAQPDEKSKMDKMTTSSVMTSKPFESTHTTIIETTDSTVETSEKTTLHTTKLATLEAKEQTPLDDTMTTGRVVTSRPFESTHATVVETTDSTVVTSAETTLDTTKLSTLEEEQTLLDDTMTTGKLMTSNPFESTHTTIIETTDSTMVTSVKTTLDTTKSSTLQTEEQTLLDEMRSMYPTEIRDGFLYIAILNRLSLADAKKTCNALHLNSHLVSMVTEEEANAVEDFITDTGEVNQKFWIGLHSPRVVWDDGNYLTFHELDIVRSNENCFSIEEPEFEWESLECTEKRHYICEAKKSDVDTAICDFTWNDSCYTVSQVSVTNDAARSACMTNTGFALLQTETLEEFEEIEDQLYPDFDSFWLGLTKTTGLPEYIWDDGSDTAVSFDKFSIYHEEHFGICHYVDAGDDFVWMDDYCDMEYFFICKLPEN